jgi:hypothetical protein
MTNLTGDLDDEFPDVINFITFKIFELVSQSFDWKTEIL